MYGSPSSKVKAYPSSKWLIGSESWMPNPVIPCSLKHGYPPNLPLVEYPPLWSRESLPDFQHFSRHPITGYPHIHIPGDSFQKNYVIFNNISIYLIIYAILLNDHWKWVTLKDKLHKSHWNTFNLGMLHDMILQWLSQQYCLCKKICHYSVLQLAHFIASWFLLSCLKETGEAKSCEVFEKALSLV